MLSGIVDVYLVDMKYSIPYLAYDLSGDIFYPSFAQNAFREMYSQTHEFILEDGFIKRGAVVRHLVLPGHIENTFNVLRWLQDNGFYKCFLSLMFQYRPYFKAGRFPGIDRRVSVGEYERVVDFFNTYCKDIAYGWIQEFYTDDSLAGVHFKKSIIREK